MKIENESASKWKWKCHIKVKVQTIESESVKWTRKWKWKKKQVKVHIKMELTRQQSRLEFAHRPCSSRFQPLPASIRLHYSMRDPTCKWVKFEPRQGTMISDGDLFQWIKTDGNQLPYKWQGLVQDWWWGCTCPECQADWKSLNLTTFAQIVPCLCFEDVSNCGSASSRELRCFTAEWEI